LLNPEWKVREKDRVAKVYLEDKIKEEGLDTQTILRSYKQYLNMLKDIDICINM